MTYPVERLDNPNPWLHAGRPSRGKEIKGVMIHASRSGGSDGDDGPRTVRWMHNPNNGSASKGWGSSCDEVIGEDGLRTLITPKYQLEVPTYCAGYGESGTWMAGNHYYQIEMAQGRIEDNYTDAQIESLAERIVELSIEHDFDPNKRILYLTQMGVPPEGICTHEGSANGHKLGKSDPGPNFPWEKMWNYIEAMLEGDDMETIVVRQEGTGALFTYPEGTHIPTARWNAMNDTGSGLPPVRIVKLPKTHGFFSGGPLSYPRGDVTPNL